MTNPTTKEVNAKEVAKALRWLAKETEFVFAAEQLRDAAALIESLQGKIVGKDALIVTNKALMNAAISENRRLQVELAASQRRESAAVEDLCGACESLTHATGHGWEYSCAACKWRGVQAGEESR